MIDWFFHPDEGSRVFTVYEWTCDRGAVTHEVVTEHEMSYPYEPYRTLAKLCAQLASFIEN